MIAVLCEPFRQSIGEKVKVVFAAKCGGGLIEESVERSDVIWPVWTEESDRGRVFVS